MPETHSNLGKRGQRAGWAVPGALAPIVLAGLLGSMQPATGQTIRWSTDLPAGHPILETVLKPWFAEVAKVTGGRVAIQADPSRWGPSPRQIDIVELQIRHAAFGALAATPRRFPVARIAELPFLSNSAEALSVAYWRTHRRYLAKAGEFARARPLALAARTPGILWSPTKPFLRIGDLDGARLMVLGQTPWAIARRLGAAPIIMPPPRARATLATRRVEGFLGLTGTVRRLDLQAHLKRRVRIPGGLYADAYIVAVTPAIWRRIRHPDRAAIMAISGARLARALGAAWDRDNADGNLTAAGVVTTDAGPELVTALKARLAVFEARWRATATARGVDAAAALTFLRAEIAREEAALRQRDGK